MSALTDKIAELGSGLMSRVDRGVKDNFEMDRQLYHWTEAEEIDEFIPSKKGKLGSGVYLSDDPQYGEKYVDMTSGNANVIPVNVRGPLASGPERDLASEQARTMLREKGEFTSQQWKEERNKILQDQGYTGIEVGGGAPEINMFDPKDLRSIFAEHKNPASKKILAGSAATAVGASALMPSEARADVGSIEPYEPNLRDSIQQKLADFMGGERDDVYRSKKLMAAADWFPVTGDATGVADTVDAYNEGDYVSAGINGFATLLGAVPLIGKPVAKGVKALGVGVNEALTDGKFLKNYGAEAMDKLDELAEFATAGTTKANALINAAVEQGRQVGIRLNLNSKIPDAPAGMDKLQTLHDKNYNGSALSYVPHATVTDVTFSVSQKGRQGIAAKIGGMDVPEAKNKFPAMSVDGKLAPSENVISKGGKGVIEIGFNPKAHHLFIDMKTGQAVKEAKVATVVGDRVYAKGVKYYKKSEAPEPLNASDGAELPSEVRYNEMNKGGTVQRGKVEETVLDSSTQEELDTSSRTAAETDEIISTPAERVAREEMSSNRLPASESAQPEEDRTKPELISMFHGGMAMGLMGPDNTVGTDPVSGNPIPIGSSAENVRDDIPAALSEGEFVVPNDVVRWFGLKRYMDMHQEAKMGLMMMHEMGQIKGDEENGYDEEDCGCGEEGCPLCEDGLDDMYGCGDENCPVCMGMDEDYSEEDSGDDEDYPEAPRAQVIVVEEKYPLDEDSEGVESYPTKGGQKL